MKSERLAFVIKGSVASYIAISTGIYNIYIRQHAAVLAVCYINRAAS